MKTRLTVETDMTAIDLTHVLGSYWVYMPTFMVFEDDDNVLDRAVYRAAQSWAADANRINWNALTK